MGYKRVNPKELILRGNPKELQKMNLDDVIFKSCGKIAENIGSTNVRLKLVKLKLVKQTECKQNANNRDVK